MAFPLGFVEKKGKLSWKIASNCPASKHLTKQYAALAQKELKKIPKNLWKELSALKNFFRFSEFS